MSFKKIVLFIILPIVFVACFTILFVATSDFAKFSKKGMYYYDNNDDYVKTAEAILDKEVELEIDAKLLGFERNICFENEKFRIEYCLMEERGSFKLGLYIFSRQIAFREGKVISYCNNKENIDINLVAKVIVNNEAIVLSNSGYGGSVGKNSSCISYRLNEEHVRGQEKIKLVLSNFVETTYTRNK